MRFTDLLRESKPNYVDGREHLIKLLKKNSETKKIIGKYELYFDDVDLVLDDKTVMYDPIWDDGTIEWDDIVKNLKKTAKLIASESSDS